MFYYNTHELNTDYYIKRKCTYCISQDNCQKLRNCRWFSKCIIFLRSFRLFNKKLNSWILKQWSKYTTTVVHETHSTLPKNVLYFNSLCNNK